MLPLCPVLSPDDCPSPEITEKFVPTKEALLLNSFPDGATISYVCANGYIKEDGTGTAVCKNSVWTDVDLNCKSESLPTLNSANMLIKRHYSVHESPSAMTSYLFLCCRERLRSPKTSAKYAL